jgi:hypothetical protein
LIKIDTCKTVAKLTHAKYGSWVKATHRKCGQTATIIHTMVPHTIRMSTVASGRFRNPEKMGKKKRLR